MSKTKSPKSKSTTKTSGPKPMASKPASAKAKASPKAAKPATPKPTTPATTTPNGAKPAPKPATRKPAKPTTVKLTVDHALKAEWTTRLATLERAKREGASQFDVQWETVGAIVEHDPPLYLAGGYSTLRDFLEKHVGEDERTARRFIRVAKYASPTEESKYGVSKLDRAITYIEAKAGGPAKGRVPIAFEKVKVPVERDGKTTLVPLESANVADIEAATRKLVRASAKAPAAKAPPLVKAVTAELKSKELHGVTVRLSGGKLFLGAIPPQSLKELSAALGRVKAQ